MTDKNTPEQYDASGTQSTATSGECRGITEEARQLIRLARKAFLATHHHETGFPYASLVAVAADPDGSPLLLLSSLAVHTKNLQKSKQASILFEDHDHRADPLEGNRLSILGEITQTSSPRAGKRFLARHPSADTYAAFDDFAFYKFTIAHAHYVGGFGRIRSLAANDLLMDCTNASELMELEQGFLSHMNKDHASAVALYATALLDAPEGDWRLCGLDPYGIDLMSEHGPRRLDFTEPVSTPDAMRHLLADLANKARTKIQI